MNNKNTLSIPVYSSSLFTWERHSHGSTGFVEMSDTHKKTTWSQVWNDSCDIGFKVRSTKTGAEVLFIFEKELKGHENEVNGWSFTSFNTNLCHRIVIYND